MILVLALVVAAALVTAAAPEVLSRGTWWMRHPRIALRAWLLALSLAAGALALSVAVAATIVLARAGSSAFGGTAAALFAWCGLAAAGGIGALLLTNAEPLSAAKRRTEIAVTVLVARAASRSEWIGGQQIAYVESDDPIACSTADGRILISTALERAMPRTLVRAVIEHERAHVRFRHDLLSRFAALTAAAFPLLPSARRFRSTVALLVELVADDEAARACGPATVCNALVTMESLDPDPALQLRARRLAQAPVVRHPHRRRLTAVRSTR